MAIDMQALVLDDLAPFLAVDTGIEAAIPRQIEAQTVLHGYTAGALTDRQAVYVAVLTTKAFVTRLIGQLGQEVKRAKGGPAEAEFQDMIAALTLLKKDLDDRVRAAAREAAPEDVIETTAPYPMSGFGEIP